MENFKKEAFNTLANIHDTNCISIYLPTHKTGQEVNNGKDLIKLKNQIKEVKTQLSLRGLSDNEISDYIKPLIDLSQDKNAARHFSNGLAIFLAKDLFKCYQLPNSFEERNHVGSHFYLKPLIPILNQQKNYFLLSLTLKDVLLYEGNDVALKPVALPIDCPTRLEEVVGFDYEEKSLQHDSKGKNSTAVFHGHGRQNDTVKKQEIEKFFRAVDTHITNILNPKKEVLIIACVDYLFPIYKAANTYNFLSEEFIEGSPETTNTDKLHKRSVEIIQKYISEDKQSRIKEHVEAVGKKHIINDIEQIVSASVQGNIDTLFINSKEQLWGRYDQTKDQVETHAVPKMGDDELFNMAAVNTLLNNGEVYILNDGEEGQINENLSAVLRY